MLRQRGYLVEGRKIQRIKTQEIVGFLRRKKIPIAWSAGSASRKPLEGSPPRKGAEVVEVDTLKGHGWLWARDGMEVTQSGPGKTALFWNSWKDHWLDLREWKKIIDVLLKAGYGVGFPPTRRFVHEISDPVSQKDVENGVIFVVKYDA